MLSLSKGHPTGNIKTHTGKYSRCVFLCSLAFIRRFNVHRFPADLYIFHTLQNLRGLLARHLNKRLFVKHINAPDQFSRHPGFTRNCTQDIARKDIVLFAKIDKEANHALLGTCIAKLLILAF